MSFAVKVAKLTDEALMQKACEFTINAKSKMTLAKIYQCEHSPLRTQIFTIEMLAIPTFVSIHFVRHKHGVEHFVKSNRDDRGGKGKETTRLTPVNHMMLCNAQALINMARKRLCLKADQETVKVMEEIAWKVREVDYDLWSFMVPECVYRQGCHELKPCGYYESFTNAWVR